MPSPPFSFLRMLRDNQATVSRVSPTHSSTLYCCSIGLSSLTSTWVATSSRQASLITSPLLGTVAPDQKNS